MLLDELACHSSYSNLGLGKSSTRIPASTLTPPLPFPDRPKNPRSRPQLLRIIYTTSGLSPSALSCITQIILQDLRPITCPLPRSTSHPALAYQVSATSKPPPVLDVLMAMEAWDWEMRELFRASGDVDVVCREVEARGGGAGRRPSGIKVFARPVPGVDVEVGFDDRRLLYAHLSLSADSQVRKGQIGRVCVENDRGQARP